MARINCSLNLAAFLDVLAHAEGTKGLGDDGYDKLVNPAGFFTSYATHPNQRVQVRPGLVSTAAGRYQHLSRHWQHYRQLLALPDFGPASQDRWAIQLIRERRALEDVEAGRIEQAITKCRNIWASLPGANYPGQPMKTMPELVAKFVEFGGVPA
ncbi:lysozyme [Zobellella denitrificans]|uniref:glycoside hydrolase family 24 protein n=1 Tax=Zobellella denitrificans TaxID=347534 RepID=UPI000B8BDFB1|nr:glycoside hydrolase family 104 protein [Zobellella denitrificans]OXS14003.1 lysozyme [Zobellella denitrificans]